MMGERCKVCGAPLSTKKCEYCGSVAKKKKIKSNKSEPVVNQTNAELPEIETEERGKAGCIISTIELIIEFIIELL